jgi:uncharacterized protein
VLVDANVLLYAVDESSPFHQPAKRWLTDALGGPHRVALPWMSLTAFLRIGTNPRALADPMTPDEAWSFVDDWLAVDSVWVPEAGRGHADILRRLVVSLDLRGNLVSDAVLASLALEHGLAIVSADSDFARFPDLTWINPITAP